MSTEGTRVAVFTPQPVVGAGLAHIFERTSGRFVLTSFDLDHPEPDVALYDVAFLADDDTTTLDILVSKTATPVMLIGTTLRPDLTARGLDAGADGYVDIAAPVRDLLAALDSATTGWKDGDTGENPIVGSSGSERAALTTCGAGLTEREHQVVALIARGYSNHEIADELFLGVNTIKTYIRALYRKIHVTNRAGAVAWAIDHGLPSS